jgi:hypothetical protein
MEDLEDKIGIEQDRKKEAEEKLQARNKLLVGIREGLDHLVQTLVLILNYLLNKCPVHLLLIPVRSAFFDSK